MSRTTVLLGPPGTGKTTALLNIVDDALKRGVPPGRIAFFAFTRKAANEAIKRARERFNITEDDMPWFRTLHSAAFHILELKSSEVMQTKHFKELGHALGSFTFEHDYDETVERPPQDGALGDRALAVYSRARAHQISVHDEWHKSNDPRINLMDATRFAVALEDYKKAFDLLDFNDFLDRVHDPLSLDILIIDEAQDLTAQQWAFARRIGAQAGQVYIAGDDDQAIFQWAGADLRMFLSIKGHAMVLPHSYRLPRTVFDYVKRLGSRIRVRYQKTFEPTRDSGRVEYLEHMDQMPLTADSVLLLTRHKWHLPMLRAMCRDRGVVYQEGGRWSNQSAAVRAVVAYEHMRTGHKITRTQMRTIASYIPGMPPLNDATTWEQVSWPFEGRPDWMHAMTSIGTLEREYIRKLRRNGESLTNPGRVVLSTIHQAKGGEADHVMVLPDISTRVVKNMDDEEARVWYVAASRSKEALFVCRPRTQKFYELT